MYGRERDIGNLAILNFFATGLSEELLNGKRIFLALIRQVHCGREIWITICVNDRVVSHALKPA